MLVMKSMDVRNNFRSICEKVYDGETVLVVRPENKGIVMLSEREYNELAVAKRELEHLAAHGIVN